MGMLRVLLAGGASLLAVASAHAQTAPAGSAPSGGQTPTAHSSGNQLQEIIVTAQRRSQSLLSVPTSVSAETGVQLQRAGIKQISELQFNTPGFLPSNGVGYTQIYIRGIGNDIYVGADPSVATFVDDVPRIYGSMVNNFVNVDRVEVLKGAQGGLYGRNATGGVVNIITRQPSDHREEEVRVSYGAKNTLEAAAYVNVPITDQIAWNIAAQRNSHDDYVKNLLGPNPLTPAMFPNGGGPVLGTAGVLTPAQTAAFFNSAIHPQSGYGNQDFWAVDSKLRFKPTDNFSITLDGDYSSKRDSEGNQWYTATPAYSQAVDSAILGQFGIVASFPAGYFATPPKFTTYNTTAAASDLTDYGGSLKAVWSLPGLEITNISAYRAQQTRYEQNYAHPITADVPIVRNSKNFWYEEMRAVSTGAGPFHYLAGATYLHDDFHGQTTNQLFPPLYTVPIPAIAAATNTYTQVNDTVRNWSIYGQLGYDFTDDLNLTASGRYINENNNAQFVKPIADSAAIKETKFLPSATLSYKLAGGGNVYVRYAKGFKAGGVNPVVPSTFFPTDYGKIFGPEEVDTYEAGLKMALFDRSVQMSTAIFYNKYQGLQSQSSGNVQHPEIILAIVNAGTARTYGAEGSVTWRVTRPITVSANVAYLEAEYTSFKNSDGSVIDTFDFSHQRMLFAPKWQLAFTGDLDQPISDKLRLTGSALTSYVSNVRAGLTDIPGTDATIRSYWLTNLRIGLRTTDDRYGVSLFVKNLFDTGYQTYGTFGSFGTNFVWGDPRIVGAEVSAKFE